MSVEINLWYFKGMKNLVTLLICMVVFLDHHAIGQAISVGYGAAGAYTRIPQPVLHYDQKGDYEGNLSDQTIISLEYPYKKINILASYSSYKGVVHLPFANDFNRSLGFDGEKISRFDFGIGYPLIAPERRIYLDPYIALGIQYSKWLGVKFWTDGLIHGPENYNTSNSSMSYTNTQIAPSLGIKFGVIIKRTIILGINIQGVYSHKSYAKIIVNYYNKDSPTVMRQAIAEGTGTGIYNSINLGIRIDDISPVRKN